MNRVLSAWLLIEALAIAACAADPSGDEETGADAGAFGADAGALDAAGADAGAPPWMPAFCAGDAPDDPSAWSSSLVSFDGDGRLAYETDVAGNRIVDFGHAGYRAGAAPLPDVPAAMTIGPVEGDNTAHIQAALDVVGALPADAHGHRGAVVLEPGSYAIHGTVRIDASGVVLRGSGDGGDPDVDTILVGVGDEPHQRTLVILGTGDGSPWDTGEAIDITADRVLVGARRLPVADPTAFSAGDQVVVHHPSTQAWLDAVDGGGVVDDAPWAPGEIDLIYVRRIDALDGDTLELDAPVFDHLDRSLSQATVAVVTSSNTVRESGVESLRVDIQTAGGEDEDHAWDAIGVVGAEHSWVRDVTVLHFGHAGVFTRGALHITVADSRAAEPVAIRTGGRMYNFDAESRSQLILFTGCEATDGRHNYISNGTSTTSGVVFHRSSAGGDNDDSEAHRRWSQALLYDTIQTTGNVEIRLANRGDWGTSHGWAAAHSVIWNTSAEMLVQRPPIGQNYAISSAGGLRDAVYFPGPLGHRELNSGGPLVPESLYEAQLCERLR